MTDAEKLALAIRGLEAAGRIFDYSGYGDRFDIVINEADMLSFQDVRAVLCCPPGPARPPDPTEEF